MCILNTLLGFAQFGGLQFHQPTLYDVDNSGLIESTRDAIEADNARSRSQLNQLANVRLKVINLLAEDIDQELRDTLNAYYQKLNTYSSQAVDPQIKQLFAKSAQDALNTKQKLMTFLNN